MLELDERSKRGKLYTFSMYNFIRIAGLIGLVAINFMLKDFYKSSFIQTETSTTSFRFLLDPSKPINIGEICRFAISKCCSGPHAGFKDL